MTICFLHFLIIGLLSPVLTSGFEIGSTVCGNDHLAYSILPGHEAFYINGDKVDEHSFCKALALRYPCQCHLRSYFQNTICVLDFSTDSLSFEPPRKLLLQRNRKGALSPENSPGDQQHTFLLPAMGMAVPGLAILGFFLLCPCFQSRRKECEETALHNKSQSFDSASLMSTNPEMVSPSPFRHAPPSPFRHAPPSPFRHASYNPTPRSTAPSQLARLDTIHLQYDDIAKATKNFSPSQIIGESIYATVYRGRLQDGREVAVKRAKKECFDSAGFDSEVTILSKIDHLNLVKLLGYVDKGHERLIITEYVPNGTLRKHLDGQHGRTLDFNQRLEVMIGVAHGLTYLHLYGEKKIIHRNVKSSNILLTERLRAKVADFGYAKASSDNGDHTHILTKVKGTVGYLDPEYMRTQKLSAKSDVYSFGILLLEILTGREPVDSKRPSEEKVLLRWVSYNYTQGNITGLIDPRMDEPAHPKILMKLFWLGIQCAAPVLADRPDMREVGERLWAIRMEHQKMLSLA